MLRATALPSWQRVAQGVMRRWAGDLPGPAQPAMTARRAWWMLTAPVRDGSQAMLGVRPEAWDWGVDARVDIVAGEAGRSVS